MHKLLLVLLMLTGISINAQDPEEDYVSVADTTYTVQIDTSSIEVAKFPPNFKSKYSDADFEYDVQPEELNFWDRFMAALAQWLRSFLDLATEESSMNIASNIVRLIAIAIVVVVVYMIVKMVLNKEGKWIFSPPRKAIRFEDAAADVKNADFEKLVADSKRLGEHRLTIRYYYLWMLQQMAYRGIITWDAEKTNSDYLREIGNEDQRSRFSYLSYLYDYIWYGEFPVDEKTFNKAVDAFETSIRSLR
ncbi:MAG: DUF4129 domain-containing protein [Flavobacterium sp.]|nr:DUF4129 domain-containing protein [Flavobacterium sp.]